MSFHHYFIKESIDTFTENAKEKHASAQISLTVQNENVASGALLIPSIPLAAAPLIQNNINEINTINYIQKEENKKAEDFMNSIKNDGAINENK